jgi:hypothetical protein
MSGGLIPDLVGDRIGAISEASGGLGQGQRGALGVGEVRRLTPRGAASADAASPTFGKRATCSGVLPRISAATSQKSPNSG